MATMIKFKNSEDEMIYDVPFHNIMVVDADCQGLMNLSNIGKKFKLEFPDLHKIYFEACVKGLIMPGQILPMESKGRHVCLLITTDNRVGLLKDTPDMQAFNMKKCLDALVKKYTNVEFSSGILLRHIPMCMGSVGPMLRGLGVTWNIHKV